MAWCRPLGAPRWMAPATRTSRPMLIIQPSGHSYTRFVDEPLLSELASGASPIGLERVSLRARPEARSVRVAATGPRAGARRTPQDDDKDRQGDTLAEPHNRQLARPAASRWRIQLLCASWWGALSIGPERRGTTHKEEAPASGSVKSAGFKRTLAPGISSPARPDLSA